MCGCRPIITVSMTVAGNTSSVCCGSRATCCAAYCRGNSASGRPSTSVVPDSASRNPASVCNDRDFPAPFLPRTARKSPATSWRFRASTSVRPGTVTVSWWQLREGDLRSVMTAQYAENFAASHGCNDTPGSVELNLQRRSVADDRIFQVFRNHRVAVRQRDSAAHYFGVTLWIQRHSVGFCVAVGIAW